MSDDTLKPDNHDPIKDSEASADDYRVGYGNPPVEHQFKKGKSGNARGRPKRPERSFTPRQIRRDILRLTEMPITIRTEKGEQAVAAIEAILLRLISKAHAGHGPSIRLIIKLHFQAIAEHYHAHQKSFGSLERAECLAILDPSGVEAKVWPTSSLNFFRKLTRQT